MVSVAADHGTMAPDASLHLNVIERPYRDGENALEATAADHISYAVVSFNIHVNHEREPTTLGAVK